MSAADHKAERLSGDYSGPRGRFFRIIDPANPTDYLGWGSTRAACERMTRSPDMPVGAFVQEADQLTGYEARYCDLAGEPEPMPFAAKQAMQDYLTKNHIDTVREEG